MTMPQFRQHLKQYFDLADSGKKVTITRYGKVYELLKVAE